MTFLRRHRRTQHARTVARFELIDADGTRDRISNRVVARDDLMSAARKFADSVLQGLRPLAQTKRLIEELWSSSVKEDVDLALKYHLQAREIRRAREGIAAFTKSARELGRVNFRPTPASWCLVGRTTEAQIGKKINGSRSKRSRKPTPCQSFWRCRCPK